ncbi:PC4-domain-containing protein [Stereum hirsutum FP-91666 SS1]|uniref:PC4-domain-containing protein n=1 Tax=Stereum hirsutum (strain FP-91666) TaxID=721885 RepID=UPI000444A845|nr:PC4-domain-containing protein [Stereum hirsutum FP-91666 SS1]EIM82706.1 PC4-domain-containing protein [Stereum hirsutum FP-91666 SS1]
MVKRKVIVEEDSSEGEERAPAPKKPVTAKKPKFPPEKKKKKDEESDDEDSESEEDAPLAKSKGKKAATSSSTSGGIAVQTNYEGEKFIDLGKKRRATVRKYKSAVLVDIREFYGEAGDEKPGKKGISLTVDQWQSLREASDTIDSLIAKAK